MSHDLIWAHSHEITAISSRRTGPVPSGFDRKNVLVFASVQKLHSIAFDIADPSLVRHAFSGTHEEAMDLVRRYSISGINDVGELWVPLGYRKLTHQETYQELEQLAKIRDQSFRGMFPQHEWTTLIERVESI